ncbi:hypothetical protein FJZ36_15185 [Candidatus Poribacteria bacterium]|nr:hypothetical protein [Candidatus Poribacteria bacterium]
MSVEVEIRAIQRVDADSTTRIDWVRYEVEYGEAVDEDSGEVVEVCLSRAVLGAGLIIRAGHLSDEQAADALEQEVAHGTL